MKFQFFSVHFHIKSNTYEVLLCDGEIVKISHPLSTDCFSHTNEMCMNYQNLNKTKFTVVKFDNVSYNIMNFTDTVHNLKMLNIS